MAKRYQSAKVTRGNLQVESLENRSVLSGFGMVSAAHHHPMPNPPAPGPTLVGGVGTTAPVQDAAPQGTVPHSHNETQLTASLSDSASGAIGGVMYESEQVHGIATAELVVIVRNATPGAKLDVSLNDPSAAAGTTPTVLGAITVDSEGNGRFFMHTTPRSTTALPTNVAEGFTVSVGGLQGTLATPTKPVNPTPTVLTSALTDSSDATVSGKVRFFTDGQKLTMLSVEVKGPTAVDGAIVAIDGVQVGTLKVDSRGVGRLSLSSNVFDLHSKSIPTNFPAVKASSVVTIGGTVDANGLVTGGTTSGTLAVPTAPAPGSGAGGPHGGHHRGRR